MTKPLRYWIACALIIMTSVSSASHAAPVHDFHAALGDADRDYRSASFYLRTGNPGVAILELQSLSEKWQALTARFMDNPPGVYATDPKWSDSLREIGTQISSALSSAGREDVAAAKHQLQPIRTALADLRRRNGVFIFADCVEEANRAMDALFVYRRKPPNFDVRGEVDELLRRAAITSHWYDRCFRTAPDKYTSSTEFKRLMEVSLKSLALIWDAAHKKQERRVINILRELRSSDRLLYLRFI